MSELILLMGLMGMTPGGGEEGPAGLLGGVNQVKQQAGSLHMPEEPYTQPASLMGARDQAGNVCHDEGAFFIYSHHPKARLEGRKGIISNSRPCGAEPGYQGGFAHVGEAHQSNIRQKLEFEL